MALDTGLFHLVSAKVKRAFVPAGDQSGGMPPGGDPAAAGGMPPGMDPAAMGGMPPGMDPAAMGGMPPGGGGAPPGGGGGIDPAAVERLIEQKVQERMAAMGQGQGQPGAGGGAAGGGMIKPKIDVNIELMQIKELLALIADALGIRVPASSMVATPEKLTAMAQGQANAGGAPPQGAIQPIQPLQGAGVPGQAKQGADYSHWRGAGKTQMQTEMLKRTLPHTDILKFAEAVRSKHLAPLGNKA